MTAWGYRSFVPFYVVALTGALVVIISLATRHDAGGGQR
jgi:hypothetical protein